MPPIPFLDALYCVAAGPAAAAGAAARAQGCPVGQARPRPVRRRPSGAVRSHRLRPPSVLVLPRARGLDERPQLRRRCRTSAVWSGRSTRSFAPTRCRAPAAAVPDRVRLRDQPAEPVPRGQPGHPGRVSRRGGVHGLARSAGARAVAVPARRLSTRHRLSPGQRALLVDVPDRAGVPARRCPSRRSTPTGCRSSLPVESFPAGGTIAVWGMLRAAPNATTQRAQIQWRGPPPRAPGGRWPWSAPDNPTGSSRRGVAPPGSGSIRLAWTPPTGGSPFYSRTVAVKQTGAGRSGAPPPSAAGPRAHQPRPGAEQRRRPGPARPTPPAAPGCRRWWRR